MIIHYVKTGKMKDGILQLIVKNENKNKNNLKLIRPSNFLLLYFKDNSTKVLRKMIDRK